MARPRARTLLLASALAALAVSKGVALSTLAPPFHAPDEPYHFDYAQALAENGALPRPDVRCRGAAMLSPEVRAAVAQLVEGVAFHPRVPVPPPSRLALPTGPGSRATTGCGPASIYPPLWYASAALAYRAAWRGGLLARLLAVRWASVAWSALAAVAALAAGVLAFGRAREGVLYALAVVLQPMTGALEASANSEAAALACATLAFAAVAALGRGVAPRRSALALGAALVLGVLAKPGFLLALPTLAGLAALALRRRTGRPLLATAALFTPAALCALAFGLSGGERTGLYDELPSGGPLLDQLARHLFTFRRFFDVWVEQYWGKLGWMDTQPGRGWYLALVAAQLLALLGLGRLRRHRRRELAVALVIGAGTLFLAGALYAIAWRRGDLLWVEGRHALVLYPAHAYLLCRGLGALSRRAPPAFHPAALLALLLAAVNVALGLRALGRFYGPAPRAALAAWQAAWGLPGLTAATGVAAGALTLALVGWAAVRAGRESSPTGSGVGRGMS